MPLPTPEPGLVFRYDYVCLRETRAAGKDRPACLVATLDDENDPNLVAILPITHSQPSGGTVGVEIGRDIAEALGLDERRSWIVISEANIDHWPNPGLALVPGKRGSFAYGYLPPAFFERVKAGFMRLLAKRQAKITCR